LTVYNPDDVGYGLKLLSNESLSNSRPGIVQYGLRTAGSGIVYTIQSAYIGVNEASAKKAMQIGVYGNIAADSTVTVNYLYLDATETGNYSNATVKIAPSKRVGIGLAAWTNPATTLDVTGTFRVRVDGGSTGLRQDSDGHIGAGTYNPDSARVVIADDLPGVRSMLEM